MKILKTILTGILFLFVSSFSVLNAQYSANDYYDYAVSSHQEELEMSQEQIAELKKRSDEVRKIQQEMWERFNESEMDATETYAKFQERDEEFTSMLQEVFTKEQLTQYKKILEDKVAEQTRRNLEYQREEYKRGAWLAAELSEDQIDELVMVANGTGGNTNEGWTAYPPLANYEGIENTYLEEKQQSILSEEQWTAYQDELARIEKEYLDKQLADLERIIPIIETVFLYYKEESFPKYQALRTRLERKIDATDKVTIKQLRATLDEFYQSMLGRGFNNNRVANDERIKAKMEIMEEYVVEGLNMYVISPMMMMGMTSGVAGVGNLSINENELKELADKYDSDINELSTELKELQAKDKERLTVLLTKITSAQEVKSIVEKITMDIAEMVNPGNKEQLEGMKMVQNLNFLLMPPTEIDLDGKALFSPNKKYKVYPSPSNGVHNLEVNLLAKDNITIELLDANGKVLQVPFSGDLTEGKHVMNYDWTKIEGTVFYYRITGKQGTETVKFIMNR